ncbi:hypothetical protein [Occallatibacter riparius]|uniref:Uncharacterized protein n=1 Tax=Occallatibacter riparius TaxID=1002689 RepID=A0A9J7BWU9_9BACT|nr:hypothetical protein [Occallatibacter riparius]UWZ85517.1 hypothetical protein MOP44_06140 [Occallatibacter riparius]
MADPLAPIIQKMLQQVMGMINTPGGQGNPNPYYFPDWIQANGYDPYGQSQVLQWNLSITDPTIVNQANAICPTIDIQSSPCPGIQSFIGVPNAYPSLTLGSPTPGGLVVSGARNAYMQSMTSNQDNALKLQAVMLLSTLPNYQKNLIVTGNFTFTQYCCCSADNTVCAGPPVPEVGTGTFTATFNSTPTITIGFNITALSPGVLNIAVSSINFVPSSTWPNDAQIDIAIDIQSIPKGSKKDAYNNLAMAAFNSADGLKQLVQQINVVLNDPSQLNFMGTALTNVIDGYLKSTHQYPFDGSYLAIA